MTDVSTLPSLTDAPAVTLAGAPVHTADADPAWWRHAVIYQVYPRSFADGNGDGIGDLPGITARLPYLRRPRRRRDLAVARSTRSPQADAGYDVADYRDVDPLFGTLADFDALLDRGPRARPQGHRRPRAQPLLRPARVVPGRAGRRPGQPRARALHLPRRPGRARRAAPEQLGVRLRRPGVDPHDRRRRHARPVVPAPVRHHAARLRLGATPRCATEFAAILRFWLDRGVDGFRVDVAHGLVKADGLPDLDAAGDCRHPTARARAQLTAPGPMWDQDGVHEIYRDWRAARSTTYDRRPHPVRRGLGADRRAAGPLRARRRDAPGVQLRLPRGRLGRRRAARGHRRRRSRPTTPSARRPPGCCPTTTWCATPPGSALTAEHPRPNGIGAGDPQPDADLGLRRARAATAADARAARLGLPLPGRGARPARAHRPARRPRARTRPGARVRAHRDGRDGCRVPMPWAADAPSLGLRPARTQTWLPQPAIVRRPGRRPAGRRRGLDARAVPGAARHPT